MYLEGEWWTSHVGPTFIPKTCMMFPYIPNWLVAGPAWLMVGPKWLMVGPNWFMVEPNWLMVGLIFGMITGPEKVHVFGMSTEPSHVYGNIIFNMSLV